MIVLRERRHFLDVGLPDRCNRIFVNKRSDRSLFGILAHVFFINTNNFEILCVCVRVVLWLKNFRQEGEFVNGIGVEILRISLSILN